MQEKIAMDCPLCHSRIFDTSTLPNVLVEISAKCPHCGSIVNVPLTPQSVRKKPPDLPLYRKAAICRSKTLRQSKSG